MGNIGRNAERVPFRGTIQNNLLLHFWNLVSLIYIPKIMSADGTYSYPGYVFAIPEPSNLVEFLEDLKNLLGNLETDGQRSPYAALIAIPEQGGLDYLLRLAQQRVKGEELSYSLSGVEIYHLEKQGNNVRVRMEERIPAMGSLLHQYQSIQKAFRNPLFIFHRIRNLLDGIAWYERVDNLFAKYPCEYFVMQKGATPTTSYFFGKDANRKFRDIDKELGLSIGGGGMTVDVFNDELASRIYRLVRSYVQKETEEKSGRKYLDFKDNKDKDGRIIFPDEYKEAREKVCNSAFLAMRGRKDEDFIEYFVGTIFSGPQFLPEKDYLLVSNALMKDWGTVRNLSMLALSANSYT